MVRMHYKEFMNMSCQERDDYLGNEILKQNPSLMERITAHHKKYNSREVIADHAVRYGKQNSQRYRKMDA